MKTRTLSITLFALSLAGLAWAGNPSEKADSAPAKMGKAQEVPSVTVAEADKLIAAGKAVAVDANSDKTRKADGYIPGAKLLSSSSTFAMSELGAVGTQALIFYCYNEKCGASHKAAERARAAGARDVRVMPAGIVGWKAAGKSVQRL